MVVLDGVFEQAPDGTVRFHEATRLSPDQRFALQRLVQRRVVRHFRTHGLHDGAATEGMLTWQGSGGFSVDASVHIEGDDRIGLERLIRYCARPPFALERLRAPDGTATYASPGSYRRAPTRSVGRGPDLQFDQSLPPGFDD